MSGTSRIHKLLYEQTNELPKDGCFCGAVQPPVTWVLLTHSRSPRDIDVWSNGNTDSVTLVFLLCVCVCLYTRYAFSSHLVPLWIRFVCVQCGREILLPFIRRRLIFYFHESTLGEPDYIYRGTFMNCGERALTGNYRLHSRAPQWNLSSTASINVGRQRKTTRVFRWNPLNCPV